MFNGYHEPPATSYNDLELERGKKSQSGPKWPCGNGAAVPATGLQSTHMHPQSHQPSELWSSKPPFIGLPNAVTPGPKCNCPSCYQIQENQSYQGDLAWRRSWFSRTYPVPVSGSHDLVKFPAAHPWDSVPAEGYPESAGHQYGGEPGEKALLYKPYVRHAEMYQAGVISTVKGCKRKEEGQTKTGDVMADPRYGSNAANAGYETFRTGRRMEDGVNYCNQGEKYLESCRQQSGLGGGYHLHPNVARRAMLEPFAKTVPSNANQNRVPSVSHRGIKDNAYHPYVEQGEVGKVNFYNASQGGVEEKHCRALYQGDPMKEQDPVHGAIINPFPSAPVDYHGHPYNRDPGSDKDLQKFVARNPQYFPRSNFPDVMKRNGQNFVMNEYNLSRKGVINQAGGGGRVLQAPSPPKPYGKFKDCSVTDKISSDLKMMMSHKDPMSGYPKAEDMVRGESVMHGHMTRAQVEANDAYAAEKGYNRMNFQACRRPEYPYGRRGVQPYDYSNGTMTIRSEIPVTVNQDGMGNFQEIRNGLDGYPRLSNFPYDGSCHQYEKLHYQVPGDSKPQFVTGQPPANHMESFGPTEKDKPEKISHLESIRQEDLCKNGTSKISPLRLLRKKKFIQQQQQKKEGLETATPDPNPKNATPPLDVRRFWATWAEEEEENVPQTQMVVLDCHNIDPEQAGLLHLYNPEPIRAVHLEDGNLVDVKDRAGEESAAPGPDTTTDGRERGREDESGNANGPGDECREPEFSLPVIAVEPTATDPGPGNGRSQTDPDDAKRCDVGLDENRNERCRRSEHEADDTDTTCAVLSRLKRDDWSPEEDRKKSVKEELPRAEVAVSPADSNCSDESRTGELPSLPDLPTSEYRKNKFLDYSEEAFCNGSFTLDGIAPTNSCPTSKDAPHAGKVRDSGEVPDDECPAARASDLPPPGSFEIDEILQKLSDINFQSPDVSGLDPEKHKTDKKALDNRKERKARKPTHKSSRTDQLTLQNISLTKPTIKFSIQKSHDLKISFKVLNNKKKKESSGEDGGEGNEDAERGYSSESGEDAKNRRRLITLKLKGLSEETEGKGEEDGGRRMRKALKKKRMRSERSPSPKTPVLKIKKSRYMVSEGSVEEGSGVTDDVSRSSEGEGHPHDDFQVHETVDSAKIKLTFKRNKNGGERRKRDEEESVAVDSNGLAEDERSNGTTPPLEDLSEDLQQDITFDPDSTVAGDEDLDDRLDPPSPVDVVMALLPTPEDITQDNTREEDPLAEATKSERDDDGGDIDCSLSEPDPIAVSVIPVVEVTPEDESLPPSDVTLHDDVTVPELEEKKPEVNACETVNSVKSTTDEEKPEEEVTGTCEDTVVKYDEEITKPEKEECGDAEETTEPDDIPTESTSPAVAEPTESELGPTNPKEQDEEGIEEQQPTNSGSEEAPNDESHQNLDNVKSEIVPEEDSTVSEVDAEVVSPHKDTAKPSAVDDTPPEEQPEVESNNTAETEEVTESHPEPEKLKEETTQEGSDVTSSEDNAGVHDNAAMDTKVEEPEAMEQVDTECLEDPVKAEPVSEEEPEVPPQVNADGYDADETAPPEETPTECEDTTVFEDTEPEMAQLVEKNNNSVDFIIDRKVSRRCSCSEPSPERTKLRNRSKSLNFEVTLVETITPEPEVMPQLDICVWDIPLPPGDAPPGNCLNLVEYFKSKLSEPRPEVLSTDAILTEDTPKDSTPKGEKVGEKEEGPVNPEVGESPADDTNKPETKTTEGAVKTEPVSANVSDREVVDGKSEATPEDSSVMRGSLYECEGLAFDETLTMADDMEEEKVSDDDKFRDIMQNCLDNAKKFLSVGNLLSGSVEDLAEMVEDRVPRDVLLARCEESGSEDLVLEPPLEVSVDFVPSFPDGGTTLCSEVLPLDNWPYLEEEVASSPLRSKPEDSDLLSSCLLMAEEEEEEEEGTSPTAYTARKLKDRSRRISEGSPLTKARTIVGDRRRRKTIEGICGRWRSFESSREEPSKSDDLRTYKSSVDGLTRRITGNDVMNGHCKRSRDHYRDRKPKREASPCRERGKGEKRTKDSDYTSSSWQPKVVLFRISKSVVEDLAVPNDEAKREEAQDTGQDKARSIRSESRHPIPNGRDSEPAERVHHRTEDARPREPSQVPVRDGLVKRKKHRFRNLHTKKRVAPETYDAGKESTAGRSRDTESDSSESSPESACSQAKSTKTNGSGGWDESWGAAPAKSEDATDTSKWKSGRKWDDSDGRRSHPSKHKESKRKREERESRHELESQCKRAGYHRERERDGRRDGQDESASERPRKPDDRNSSRHRYWVCEVCGFSKASDRAAHIQSHPFHCQSCHLAFKTETNFVDHLTRKHKDIRNQHHCLLCELSFDLEKDYHRHLETREHKHLESVEKNTINTLFTLLTGHPCPVLGPVESRPEWLPSQAGTVHFYHQATPLSLALQYLKLHHDKRTFSTAALSPRTE